MSAGGGFVDGGVERNPVAWVRNNDVGEIRDRLFMYHLLREWWGLTA